jgi:Cu+-exporting ATPase
LVDQTKTISKEQQTTDPVCGMSTESPESDTSYEYQGETYHFCSEHCLKKFQVNPRQYLHEEAQEAQDAPTNGEPKGSIYTCPMHPEVRQEGPGECPKCGMHLEPVTPKMVETKTEWTCPMHPEIVRNEPGDCPKCGMALEPRTVTAEEDEDREYIYMRAALTLPVLFIAMRDAFGLNFLEALLGAKPLHWAEFIWATPVVLWGGWIFYVRAWKSIVSRNLNMFTLIGLGTAVAYIYSVVALLFPHIFPPSFRSVEGTVGVYFEAAAVIITLVLLGQMLELRARSRTGAAIKALLGLAPKTARRINPDGTEEDVSLDQVQVPWRKDSGGRKSARGFEQRG